MKDAVGESVSVRVSGRSSAGEEAEFGASGKIISFHGFLKAYVEDVEDDAERDDRERRLPPLAEGDPLRGELGACSFVLDASMQSRIIAKGWAVHFKHWTMLPLQAC